MNREWVYNQLEDEESKDIYKNICAYHDSGDYAYIKHIIKAYVPEFAFNIYSPGGEMDFAKRLAENNKRIIIYGCGLRGKRLCKLIQNAGGVLECFCDSDDKKWGTLIDNKIKVLSFERISQSGLLTDAIIVVSPNFNIRK